MHNEKRVNLKISLPVSKALSWGIAFLLLMSIGIELIARTDWVQSKIPFQAFGTNHIQFEMQLNNFFAFVEDHGSPNCIIMGTSMPFRGIDPEKLQDAYTEQTGSDILCYNISATGIHFRDLNLLSEIVIANSSPNLVIIGTSPFDFTQRRELSLNTRFSGNDWLLFQTGEFSTKGWLVDSSYAFRIILFLSYYAPQRFNFGGDQGINNGIKKWNNQLTPAGYGNTSAVEENINKPMNQGDTKKFIDQFGNFSFSQTNLAGLDLLIDFYSQNQVEIIIIEMPYSETMTQIVGADGKVLPEQKLIETFITEINQEISDLADNYGIQYLSPQITDQIPDDGWRDRYHLNNIGSPILSRWLGEYLADAVESGIITDPSTKD